MTSVAKAESYEELFRSAKQRVTWHTSMSDPTQNIQPQGTTSMSCCLLFAQFGNLSKARNAGEKDNNPVLRKKNMHNILTKCAKPLSNPGRSFPKFSKEYLSLSGNVF